MSFLRTEVEFSREIVFSLFQVFSRESEIIRLIKTLRVRPCIGKKVVKPIDK